MDISGEYRIDARRERVWAALNDPEVLQSCIPGCEAIEQISATEMRAMVTAVIGPVKAKFKTHIELQNLNPPESYTLSGNAKAGATGFGRGSADVTLDDTGDGQTNLRYSADFKVGGKLAQVGSRLVAGATRKTADEFFSNLTKQLGTVEPTANTEGQTVPTSRPYYVTVIAVIVVLLMLYFVLG